MDLIEKITFWLIATAFVMFVAWRFASIFRKGARQRRLTLSPLKNFVYVAFLVPVALWITDILEGEETIGWLWRICLGVAAAGFVGIVWFTGFAFGRWRRKRDRSIIH